MASLSAPHHRGMFLQTADVLAWLRWSIGGPFTPQSWAELPDKGGLISFCFVAVHVQACLLSTQQSLWCLRSPSHLWKEEELPLSCQPHGVGTCDLDNSFITWELIRSLISCRPAAVWQTGCDGGQSGSRFSMRTRLPTPTWCKASRRRGRGKGVQGCWVMSPGPQSHKSK